MKKISIILLVIGILLSLNTKKEIEDESVRFRVISNSNEKEDIENKIKVKSILTKEMKKDLKDVNTYDDTLKTLESNKNKYDKLVYKTLKSKDYNINLGKNYFPSKGYNGVYYNGGKYESLIVTIGKGEGKNFWCALFPPLCFIDDNNKKDIEYHSFIKDLIDKFIK